MKLIASLCWLSLFVTGGRALAFDVQILSATVKDQTIAGAEVLLQKNGESTLKGLTDATGKVHFEKPFAGIDDHNLNMIVKKDGYSNLVVKCPCAGLSYALSPHMPNLDGLRIVLAWGLKPADLDSHLAYAGSHVFFSRKNGDGAGLDVDDVNSFGPETITIHQRKSGVKYLYAVHNYSEGDRKGSVSISTSSQAKVFVYIGSSLVRTFTPPLSKVGNTWVVFGIGENGEFYDINKFADFNQRESVGSFLTGIINSGNFQSIPDVNSDQSKLAKQLNAQGEKEYHRNNYESATSLYLDAINNNPEYSQAYSNLGLVYQKMGKKAEAIWANRKAIALASGATKNTVQASSLFNIARVYEEEGNWEAALESYRSAKGLRDHALYTKGIERMTEKLKR
jgi:uncharacterized protein YfaP (DUF2135 family)